jgi:hypothetical protein
MGKKLKIFAFLAVFFAFFLLPGPVKSECYVDAYGNCTGTCDCSKFSLFKCGTCECAFDEYDICQAWYTCHSCVTNTPAPQPTATPVDPGSTSPTPRPGGMECSTTAECYNSYCLNKDGKPIPDCSSVCINGHCYTTHPGINPTITDVSCQSSNDYGPWSGCMSGQNACGGCASQGYTCQVRYCIHPPNSNQYQISCGCSQPPGGGGGGGSNTTSLSLQLLDPNLNIITPPVRLYCPPTPTPSPYRSPTPTPTIRCYSYITPEPSRRVTVCPTYPPPTFGPQPPGNYACFYQHTSLCKVRCDTTPCTSVACEQDVSYANFKGVPADRGGGIFDPYNLLTVIGITPIQNKNLKEGNNLPDCQNNHQLKNCYTWSQALSSGYRLINYIVVTSTPTPTATPTPNPHWIKLKNASFSSPRPLTQPIPASPVAFDADDDGSSPYFIIASCF